MCRQHLRQQQPAFYKKENIKLN
jgi:hypothetical protein